MADAAWLWRRFARSSSGADLIAVHDCAIPIVIVDLIVRAVRRSSFAVVDEFVLRAVAVGATDEAAIAALLGLDDRRVRYALTTQILARRLWRDPGSGAIALTPDGELALSRLVGEPAGDRRLRVAFDHVARVPTDVPKAQAVSADGIAGSNLIILPALSDGLPAVHEVPVSGLRRLKPARGLDILDLVGIEHVSPGYRSARLLVYDIDGLQVEMALCIGDVISMTHGPRLNDAAFLRALLGVYGSDRVLADQRLPERTPK